MKRMILVAAAIVLVALTTGAQQTQAPAVKMMAEYQLQLTELQQQSNKFAKDNAPLISACKDIKAQQQAFDGAAAILITRAAMASHMTVEQLDSSILSQDDKGNYQWVAKPKAASASVPAGKSAP